MTELAFHFNVPDKLAYACRLLRKAASTGARLTVTGPGELLTQLDTALWTFSATEFLPHCQAQANTSLVRRSAVVLAQSPQDAPGRDVLVNLGAQVPKGFDAFLRVIELVSTDDDDRQTARQRWKHYAGLGFNPVRYDLSQRSAT